MSEEETHRLCEIETKLLAFSVTDTHTTRGTAV